ncbi:MAG: lipopolysaccharide/colanic/teichoic acid biosynthesis glycosyltransferase [Candidatus Marinamargulisbacteria bacterium]|jgi:lipopolysaccharide/colanic/teichoic acid biosynthesis glycosyltransferase
MNKNEIVKTGWLKIGFDFLTACLLLAVLSPLFGFIILCIVVEGLFIKENRGPIFYAEQRISQGKPFKFFKFRIFKRHAIQAMVDEQGYISTKDLENKGGAVTWTGTLLKKYYLDELPQIWNVLIGDMSFVGTRPWNVPDYEREISQGVFRKKVLKAGLVGLVQIKKGVWKTIEEQRRYDDIYIEKCKSAHPLSLLACDFSIIFRSIWVVVRGEGL